ncbi:MAG TPA: thioredoxin [Longimicrobiaceae bacterium]|nr:thioredoxin [Longimicrobiaceae bacterium]
MADSENVVTLTDQNFTESVAQGVVMVDFWAVWCGPCRMVAPFVEQLADQYAGKVVVGKLDVDNNQRTAAQYNVRSIPTMLFFKDGALVDTVVGAVPKPVLERKLQEQLNGASA